MEHYVQRIFSMKDSLSIDETTPIISIGKKEKPLHTGTNGGFVLEIEVEIFPTTKKNTLSFLFLPRGSIRSWSIFVGRKTQHQRTTTFFLSPSSPLPSPNQITESPSPQQQQAGWIIVDSTSINLRDITSQYSSGFTLLDAPFSSLISSSARLI